MLVCVTFFTAGLASFHFNGNLILKKSAFGIGGDYSQSGNLALVDIIGQPSTTGEAFSANYRVSSGFLANKAVAGIRIIRLSGDLDFGDVAVGSSEERILTIHSDGNSTLHVSSISYPSGFSGAWSGNISAHGSSTVIITFSPTEAKAYSGTITVNSDKTVGTDTIYVSGTGTIESNQVIVWPGDTDNNGIVNQADILPLGLHWHKTGTERTAGNTLQWTGQSATPWTPDERATYADANGEGIVNQADILAVGLNWGKQHTASQTVLAKQTTTERPAGTFNLSIQKNDSKTVMLKVEAHNFCDVFGLAFELEYPEEQLEVTAVEPGDLFGPAVLFYQKIDNGKIGMALTQKVSQSSTGKGNTVARLTFHLKASATEVAKEEYVIKSIFANDAFGSSLQLDWQPPTDTEALAEGALDLPKEFQLFPNYPNPFNPTTTISYALPKASHVQMQIFDLTGRLVKKLLDKQQNAGMFSVTWDAREKDGSEVASGIYICRLQAGARVLHHKLLLVK